jgi:hypothetical protein
MKFLRTILLLLTLLPLTACGLTGGIVSGKVLEEMTGKPISGAIVVVRWKGYVSAIADTQTVCVHVESTATDERGNYKMSGWSKPSTVGPVLDLKPVVDAYKAGYGLPSKPAQKDEDVYLASFKGTSGERLKYLERMARSSGCHAAGESEKNLYPLYEALYFEARNYAVTEDDRKKLQWLREVAAEIAVGLSDQLTHAENEKRTVQFLREHLK